MLLLNSLPLYQLMIKLAKENLNKPIVFANNCITHNNVVFLSFSKKECIICTYLYQDHKFQENQSYNNQNSSVGDPDPDPQIRDPDPRIFTGIQIRKGSAIICHADLICGS